MKSRPVHPITASGDPHPSKQGLQEVAVGCSRVCCGLADICGRQAPQGGTHDGNNSQLLDLP